MSRGRKRANLADMCSDERRQHSADHACVVLEPVRDRAVRARCVRDTPRDSWDVPQVQVAWHACGERLRVMVRPTEVIARLSNPTPENAVHVDVVVVDVEWLPSAVRRVVLDVQAVLNHAPSAAAKRRRARAADLQETRQQLEHKKHETE